ncbi:MAG: hypothetical protein IJK87_14610 [Prevotella sp.]|nr:hypothetical protein [Prevotella sp.]
MNVFMHIIINIAAAVLLVGGAFALFAHFDKVVARLFGRTKVGPIEDLHINNENVSNFVGSEYTTYLLSVVIGAIMEIGNAIGGRFILGFHGFWSSLCTLLPLLLFAAYSLHVYFVLEAEESIGRIIGRLLFLAGVCVFGFLAGATAMALIFLVICLVIVLVFAILAIDGGNPERIKIIGKGLFSRDKIATRNWDGTYTDEDGGHWKKNSNNTVTKI